ncbi:MAG: outer membrane lipoprotein-sorting protein [Planctomycetia bacterium]|nr:outer membrane lipoprotein-sorting protein [Planctomycetia bacterium]
MTANLSMILENSRGDQRIREIKQFIKDFGDTEKKIMFFTAPADIKNTTFMNWSYANENKSDDQWIYLPALKKIKRISSDSKNDYFMGSDFTYDDLGDRHPAQDTHTILKEEMINGVNCYVIESIPNDKDYMYSRTVTWVIKDKWIGLKKEFYDEDNEYFKQLTLNDYKEFDNIIVITSVIMKNEQENHQTEMRLSNVRINSGISDSQFTERMMKRGI